MMQTCAMMKQQPLQVSSMSSRGPRMVVSCSSKKPISNQKKSISNDIVLNSTLVPAITLAAINPIKASLEPIAANLNTLGLPDWLIHWGHPANMAVVLIAMGGYGTYLGWQIRLSDNPDVVMAAKEAHPKLAAGMSVFFALGAIGGLLSLTMQGKDIMNSPHFITGVVGLIALAAQAMMPLFFAEDPNARGIHAFLGSGIMALFLVHLALGLQLGFSI